MGLIRYQPLVLQMRKIRLKEIKEVVLHSGCTLNLLGSFRNEFTWAPPPELILLVSGATHRWFSYTAKAQNLHFKAQLQSWGVV